MKKKMELCAHVLSRVRMLMSSKMDVFTGILRASSMCSSGSFTRFADSLGGRGVSTQHVI